MRCFIAFKVDNDVKLALQEAQNALQRVNPDALVTYTKPDTWHLTAVFLGEVDENTIENIKQMLKQILDKYSKFTFKLDKIDAFPNKFIPKVIVVKVKDEVGESVKFQSELVKQLQELRLEIENKKWTPHLTLGRNKNNDKINFENINIEPIAWTVNSVELMQSELRPEGPKYTVLESFSFKN